MTIPRPRLKGSDSQSRDRDRDHKNIETKTKVVETIKDETSKGAVASGHFGDETVVPHFIP